MSVIHQIPFHVEGGRTVKGCIRRTAMKSSAKKVLINRQVSRYLGMRNGKMAPKACAACRSQRKRCSDECLLAPYFPSDNLERFEIVQKVYGINRIIKMLKDVKAKQRADVVNSLVYEATARVEDPVYGCSRATHQLQKRIEDLESQLTATQAELLNVRSAYEKLGSLVTVGSHDAEEILCSTSQQNEYTMYEEADPMMLWEPLWEV